MNSAIRTYTLTAYTVTWAVALTGYALYKSGVITLDALNLLYNAAALGPFVGAMIAARRHYGRTGVGKALGTFRLNGLGRTALLIAASPLLFLAVGLLVYPLLAGRAYTFAETQRQFNLTGTLSYAAWIIPFISFSVFEEFGWRGFFLPHLQARYTAMRSTIILTAIWACWHLPFFLWRFRFSALITIGFFFSIFIGSIIITVAFNSARGSIVPAILFHLANNVASALDKEYTVAVVSLCFVGLALYLVRRFGSGNLCSGTRVGNFYQSNNQSLISR